MRILGISIALALAASAIAQDDTRKSVLLTGNGLANPKFSAYKKAPAVELKGAGYYAVPPMFGEKGDAKSLIPFTKGAITNGDSTSAWKRKPGPYTYWHGKPRGELFMHFGQTCWISRIRICLLFSKSSECGAIEVYNQAKIDEDGKEVLVKKIEKPVTKWNDIEGLDCTTDRLRFVFQGAGKTYIHITEIEVWGVPMGEERSGKKTGE